MNANCGGPELDRLDGVLDLEKPSFGGEGVHATIVLAPCEVHGAGITAGTLGRDEETPKAYRHLDFEAERASRCYYATSTLLRANQSVQRSVHRTTIKYSVRNASRESHIPLVVNSERTS